MVGDRITVSDLERLPADSPVTPSERLRRLAAVTDHKERENPWPAVAYAALDRDSPSIFALIDECLVRQERECP